MVAIATLRSIAQRLSEARQAAGLTVVQLAALSGVEQDSVEAIEAGRTSIGSARAVRLARALSIPPASLLHTASPAAVLHVDPTVLLRRTAIADLEEADTTRLGEALRRAVELTELGRISGFDDMSLEGGFDAAGAPWQQGYQLASLVRGRLPERPGAIRNLRRLIEDRFGILVSTVRFESRDVLGAAAKLGRARLIAIRDALSSEVSGRFVLAHELCHHLMDLPGDGARSDSGDPEGDRFWSATSPVEQRANAFAAMFLAPRDLVGRLAPAVHVVGTVQARELTLKVMGEVGMGFAACAWHLKNLGYWDEPMVRSVLATAPSAGASGFEDASHLDGLDRRVLHALDQGLISEARARELEGDRWDDLADLRR